MEWNAEEKSTNKIYIHDTYVEHIYKIHMYDLYIRYIYMIEMHDIYIYDIYVRYICIIFWSISLLCSGDLGIAKNYQGITLTSIAAKICNALLLNCIKPEIDKESK